MVQHVMGLSSSNLGLSYVTLMYFTAPANPTALATPMA